MPRLQSQLARPGPGAKNQVTSLRFRRYARSSCARNSLASLLRSHPLPEPKIFARHRTEWCASGSRRRSLLRYFPRSAERGNRWSDLRKRAPGTIYLRFGGLRFAARPLLLLPSATFLPCLVFLDLGTLPILGSPATTSSHARMADSSKSGASIGRTCQLLTGSPSNSMDRMLGKSSRRLSWCSWVVASQTPL